MNIYIFEYVYFHKYTCVDIHTLACVCTLACRLIPRSLARTLSLSLSFSLFFFLARVCALSFYACICTYMIHLQQVIQAMHSFHTLVCICKRLYVYIHMIVSARAHVHVLVRTHVWVSPSLPRAHFIIASSLCLLLARALCLHPLSPSLSLFLSLSRSRFIFFLFVFLFLSLTCSTHTHGMCTYVHMNIHVWKILASWQKLRGNLWNSSVVKGVECTKAEYLLRTGEKNEPETARLYVHLRALVCSFFHVQMRVLVCSFLFVQLHIYTCRHLCLYSC